MDEDSPGSNRTIKLGKPGLPDPETSRIEFAINDYVKMIGFYSEDDKPYKIQNLAIYSLSGKVTQSQ